MHYKKVLAITGLLVLQILSVPEETSAAITAAVIGASISAGASLIGTSVLTLSRNAANRNVVIEITNHLENPLYGGNYFLQWGWNKVPAPSVIQRRTREAIQFEKVADTATGTSGILSYAINDARDPAKFLIAFSVPYNYIHASNWFGLSFLPRDTTMNKALYDKLYNDDAWKNPKIWKKFGYAYQGRNIAIYHNDYIISASMSNFGRSTIKIDVQKVTGGYARNHRQLNL